MITYGGGKIIAEQDRPWTQEIATINHHCEQDIHPTDDMARAVTHNSRQTAVSPWHKSIDGGLWCRSRNGRGDCRLQAKSYPSERTHWLIPILGMAHTFVATVTNLHCGVRTLQLGGNVRIIIILKPHGLDNSSVQSALLCTTVITGIWYLTIKSFCTEYQPTKVPYMSGQVGTQQQDG